MRIGLKTSRHRHAFIKVRNRAAAIQACIGSVGSIVKLQKERTMPAKSKAFQRLAGAAAHGAKFPMAKKLRKSMTSSQLHEFASGSMKGKPEHTRKAAHENRYGRLRHGG